jgi:hypothetical protein
MAGNALLNPKFYLFPQSFHKVYRSSSKNYIEIKFLRCGRNKFLAQIIGVKRLGRFSLDDLHT